jgi:phosphatidylglycerophosphate synthase
VTRDRVAVVDRSRLVGSARVRDGFYSTFVVRRVSRHLTGVALRLGLRPNEVTVGSLLIAFVAAGLFARGELATTLVAAVLLQLSLVVDCVDGEVARYTGRFTAVGAWLDGVGDRLKEYCVYAGLAAGYHAWALAGALLVVQVYRHHVDFGFAANRADAAERSSDRVTELSERTSSQPALMWAKRVLIMPIGERWLVISVVSVAAGGRAALWTLLVTCSVAALYTTAGRVLRALARPDSPLDPEQLSAMTALLPPPAEQLPLTRSRLAGWLPSLVRAGELAALLIVAAHHGLLPVAFALATVVALDGYDLVYRLRQAHVVPARWRRTALLGALPRLVVELALVAALSTDTARRAVAVLATALALVCVVELTGWLRSAGSAS